jgi:hypothetical protein
MMDWDGVCAVCEKPATKEFTCKNNHGVMCQPCLEGWIKIKGSQVNCPICRCDYLSLPKVDLCNDASKLTQNVGRILRGSEPRVVYLDDVNLLSSPFRDYYLNRIRRARDNDGTH